MRFLVMLSPQVQNADEYRRLEAALNSRTARVVTRWPFGAIEVEGECTPLIPEARIYRATERVSTSDCETLSPSCSSAAHDWNERAGELAARSV